MSVSITDIGFFGAPPEKAFPDNNVSMLNFFKLIKLLLLLLVNCKSPIFPFNK